jgi:anti-anti-sigma factor
VTWEMWLHTEGDEIVVALKGSLTGRALERVERALAREISGSAGRSLRVELAGVDDIDAEGIGMLRRSRQRARMRGARLAFSILSPQVRSAVRGCDVPDRRPGG